MYSDLNLTHVEFLSVHLFFQIIVEVENKNTRANKMSLKTFTGLFLSLKLFKSDVIIVAPAADITGHCYIYLA